MLSVAEDVVGFPNTFPLQPKVAPNDILGLPGKVLAISRKIDYLSIADTEPPHRMLKVGGANCLLRSYCIADSTRSLAELTERLESRVVCEQHRA